MSKPTTNMKEVYDEMHFSDNDELGASSSESSESEDESASAVADMQRTKEEVGPLAGGGKKKKAAKATKKKPSAASSGAKATKKRKSSGAKATKKRKSSGDGTKKRKRKRQVSAGGGAKRDMTNSPFMREQLMSNELHAVLGGAATRPRPHVVRELWAYIKKHALQDPASKRDIICDAPLKSVFGKSTVNMFEMQKLLSAHLRPVDGQ